MVNKFNDFMFYFDSSELPETKKPPQINDPQRLFALLFNCTY